MANPIHSAAAIACKSAQKSHTMKIAGKTTSAYKKRILKLAVFNVEFPSARSVDHYYNDELQCDAFSSRISVKERNQPEHPCCCGDLVKGLLIPEKNIGPLLH